MEVVNLSPISETDLMNQATSMLKFAKEVKARDPDIKYKFSREVILRPLNSDEGYTTSVGVTDKAVNVKSEGIAEPSL